MNYNDYDEPLLREQIQFAKQNRASRVNALRNNKTLQRVIMGATRGLTGEIAKLNNIRGQQGGQPIQNKDSMIQSRRFVESMCEEMNAIQEIEEREILANQQPKTNIQQQPQERIVQQTTPSVNVSKTNYIQEEEMDINDYIGKPRKKEEPKTNNVTLSDVVGALHITNQKLEMVCKLLGMTYQNLNVIFEKFEGKVDKSNDYLQTLVSSVPSGVDEELSWDEDVPELGEYDEELSEESETTTEATPEDE